MSVSEERLLSLEDVADRLQVSDQSVRRWIKAGKLAAYKPGLEWRIRPSDLEDFLETHSSPKVQAPLPSADQRRSPTAAQLDAIEGLKRYCDLLEGSVRRQESDDMIATVDQTVHQVGMHGYLKVLALLAEDEATLPALRPLALRFTDLARKYIQLVEHPDEEVERSVVNLEEYFRSRRAG
jgi:excisionase family DNA binding protein